MSHKIATSRYASYSLSATDFNIMETLPDQFKPIDVNVNKESKHTASGVSWFTFTWIFRERDWALWPDFCDWANIQPALRRHTSFEWPLEKAIDEKHHNVLLFSPARWSSAETVSANIWEIQYCEKCTDPQTGVSNVLHVGLRENPSINIRIRDAVDRCPHIFAMPDMYGAIIISTELFSVLKTAGLATGLAAFPAKVSGHSDNDFMCIYSIVDVGGRVGPYGFFDACDACSRRSPKFEFYPTFTRPPEDCHWAASYPNVDRFLISGKVWHWLENEGNKLLGQRPNGDKHDIHRLQYDIAGWYPDEKDEAFLPEPFQARSF